MTFNPNEKNKLPVLICRNFVGFPNNEMSIYAERTFSKKAVELSSENYGGYVFIVTQLNGNRHFDFKLEDVCHYGVVCKIDSVSKNAQTLRVKVTALERAVVDGLYFSKDDTSYLADFEVIQDEFGDKKYEEALVEKIITFFQGENVKLFDEDNIESVIKVLNDGVNASQLANILSFNVSFDFDIKIKLLEITNLNEKLETILVNLNAFKEYASYDEKINQLVQKNIEQNQKEFYLREKIRAIQQELGEDANEINIIQDKIDKGSFPDHIKAKLVAELKRYKSMPQASLEASLIKNYMDLIFDLPWSETTEDNDDLKNVQKTLDEDHYGLVKPKERIIEYLAVKHQTGSLKAPILCFYGPPGVGKTSLGRSIARALGRKFIKTSLGGIGDEAEIRGHRRTYVGSLPGRIIQGMKKAKTINPVFLLDEIDKLSDANYKGDPASALLEVLDPEQNFAFNDNFLEEPYDLSKAMFICTANYLENIPAPLRDRLELIEVNSYTILEKMEIAKGHLIKKQREENGLNKKQITFDDEAIAYIIERYTREAGVRELERKIGQICRKVVVDLLNNKKLKTVTIDVENVKKYLGIEIFEASTKEKEAQVGIVTGLAYTAFGGDTLPIEVTHFPGKGHLVLTGKLGDVMKESCSIALDYIKANQEKLGISKETFENTDIHIHFPEGAVPKDGPSAGCAITVAIVSCLKNIKVSGDIAMTGEVTLRGNAIPIGGLREKSLAALRSGIKTILIPKGNKDTVSELPKEITENLNIIYMENVSEAIKYCLDI